MQKGRPVTAGSKMLSTFVAPIDATAVKRLIENNIALAGRTEMSEFGIVRVMADKPEELSGAVRAVADGTAGFVLCNDLFGMYRRQAAQNGLCYIHPTYGTVSRYGLIPLASSMDQIGVLCRNPADGFGLLSLIAGHDPNDGAMYSETKYTYSLTKNKLTVCIPKGIVSQADAGTQESIRAFAGKFKTVNAELEHYDAYKQVLYILASAEISANISRYDGVKFGHRASGYKSVDELYTKTRTEGFGLDTKLAAVMGTMALSHDYYVPRYEKAMKIRRLIKESLRFDGYDVIILPASVGGDPYDNLSLYALPALVGLPSLSLSYQGHGIQLIANVRDENGLFTAWEGAGA